MSPEELIGTWELADFTITFSDGRQPLVPLGEDASGLLLYAADGHLSAVLNRAGRSTGSAGLEEGHAAVTSEDYVSYAGRWCLTGDTIHHTITLSLVPEVVGQTLSRRVTLHDGRLTLTYDRTPRSGITRHYRLTWRRPDERAA
ncbi:MAG: hypothetical protein ACI8RZ_006379 [Myxococcota bacterium]